METLVNDFLNDLGLYGTVPTTFPELIVWVVTVTVAFSLIAGVFKTIFWAIAAMGRT